MIKKLVLGISVMLLSCLFARAEGTVATNKYELGSVKRLQLSWTSSTNEWVSTTTDYVEGEILRVTFQTGTGTEAPINLYDITLTDTNGFDVLAGQGANLASNVTSSVCPAINCTDGSATNALRMVIDSRLDLTVTNCGSLKTGEIQLYLR